MTIKQACVALFTSGALITTIATAEDAPRVQLFSHTSVDEAFSTGKVLITNSHYKVLAGRRVEPGAVEVHEHDTDVIYVTEGSATIVTNGTVDDAKTEKPGEIRGVKINGGTAYQLVKGDILVIPKGVPHWFREVSGTFLYLVVKVTE